MEPLAMMTKGDFTLARVRGPDFLLFETISGSRSFGTEHAKSDTDLRGVFVAPRSFLCGLESFTMRLDVLSNCS